MTSKESKFVSSLSPEDIVSCFDVVLNLTSLDYGKQRFFFESEGGARWYDRNDATYISTEEMLDRAYNSIADWIEF